PFLKIFNSVKKTLKRLIRTPLFSLIIRVLIYVLPNGLNKTAIIHSTIYRRNFGHGKKVELSKSKGILTKCMLFCLLKKTSMKKNTGFRFISLDILLLMP